MTAGQRARPANMENIVAINQGKRPLSRETTRVPALAPQLVLDMMQKDVILVDARDQAEFGAAHPPGAFNVQLATTEFEQRIGWVTPPQAPIILLTETSQEAQHAAYLMGYIGLAGRVQGYVRGGMAAWIDAGLPHTTLTQISIHQLQQQLGKNGLEVLDVRSDVEWDDGHVEGAHHMHYKDLPDEMDKLALAPETAVAVICASGQRSSTAGSLLQRGGFERVHNVTGGMGAWEAAGLPVGGEQ